MKYNIGDKVCLNDKLDNECLYGYIVGIEIDPLKEYDVSFEVKNYITYKVRVFKEFYVEKYFDFHRSEEEITLIEQRLALFFLIVCKIK